MTGLSNGRVAAVWISDDAGDGDGLTIRLRLFDADGAALAQDAVVTTIVPALGDNGNDPLLGGTASGVMIGLAGAGHLTTG